MKPAPTASISQSECLDLAIAMEANVFMTAHDFFMTVADFCEVYQCQPDTFQVKEGGQQVQIFALGKLLFLMYYFVYRKAKQYYSVCYSHHL